MNHEELPLDTDCGKLTFRIEQILKERGISKNQVCKALDIPRANFNRYCRDEFQRLDAGLICKLCWYLDIGVGELIEGELIEYVRPKDAAAQ